MVMTARSIFALLGVLTITTAATAQSLELGVIEYHNTQLDHYFLATHPESALIDAGSAGPGWIQTGYFFRTSILFGMGEAPVCRFYGSYVIGPNSHFFTNDVGECEFLKRLQAETPDDQPRWNYEGRPFHVGVPTNGKCVQWPYLRPVHRFYNRGFERGFDSNHRYVLDDATMLQMYGRGWRYEGVAFCALP